MASGCATGLGARTFEPRVCGAGLDGSFVQLSTRELGFDPGAWRTEMAMLRSAGVRTVVAQFTGDERGPFDRQRPQDTPVRRLIDSAAEAGMRVWLGLHADPRWPHGLDRGGPLPPPLDDPALADELARLCLDSPSCEGFYLSPELDDHRGLDSNRGVAAFVARTSLALRVRAPEKRISLAPFFTGKLSPEEHAAFWQPVLRESAIDVFMLQDGVGTGRATPKTARLYLEALRRVIPARESRRGPIELWSVIELFRQLSGPPLDARDFAAEPASFDVIARSLVEEGAVADRLIAFSVPDYMDPRRGAGAARLYDDYRRWCDDRAVASRKDRP